MKKYSFVVYTKIYNDNNDLLMVYHSIKIPKINTVVKKQGIKFKVLKVEKSQGTNYILTVEKL